MVILFVSYRSLFDVYHVFRFQYQRKMGIIILFFFFVSFPQRDQRWGQHWKTAAAATMYDYKCDDNFGIKEDIEGKISEMLSYSTQKCLISVDMTF